jgi:hypothetical protein
MENKNATKLEERETTPAFVSSRSGYRARLPEDRACSMPERHETAVQTCRRLGLTRPYGAPCQGPATLFSSK